MTLPVTDPITDPATDPTDPPAGDPPVDPAASGDKDWKAEFEAQQRINRDIERRNKQHTRDLQTQLEAALAKNAGHTADGAVTDPEVLRTQIRAELETDAVKDRALNRLEAKAARTFANPEDARTFLAGKVDDFVDGSGKTVDERAIQDALDDLLKERPYLGITQGGAGRFQGSADGGARGGDGGKPQLTEGDLARMTPEQIVQARKDGQLARLLKPS